MNAVDGTPAPEPFFLEGPAGPLFALYCPPAPARANERGVILVLPFAEEMNQSRRMMALQARTLARAGIGALTVDLFGTGDSAGDFADARWEIWHRDIDAAVEWIKARGHTAVALLGLRLGGLLAMEVAAADLGSSSGNRGRGANAC